MGMVALASAGTEAGSTFTATMSRVAQGFEVLSAVVLVRG